MIDRYSSHLIAILACVALSSCGPAENKPPIDPAKIVIATPVGPDGSISPAVLPPTPSAATQETAPASPSAPDATPPPAIAPVTPPSPPVDLAALPPVTKPLVWAFADNVSLVKPAFGQARPGFAAFGLEATSTLDVHRIGLNGVGPPASITVTVWVKTSPGTDLMFELAALDSHGAVVDYGVSYFDVARLKVVPNTVVTPKTQMKKAQITRDGDWIKVSGPIISNNNQLSIVVGMVSGGSHVFAGSSQNAITIGGVAITSK